MLGPLVEESNQSVVDGEERQTPGARRAATSHFARDAEQRAQPQFVAPESGGLEDAEEAGGAEIGHGLGRERSPLFACRGAGAEHRHEIAGPRDQGVSQLWLDSGAH